MEKGKSLCYGKVYPFTNENLSSYNDIYDFKGADVLSVVGSGDQYFSSILFGANSVTLFDNNVNTLYYFYLKFYSIMVLSYEEFINFFVNTSLQYTDSYIKVREYLPIKVRAFFDNVMVTKGLSSLVLPRVILSDMRDFNSGRVIPYLDRDNYYKLQEMLKSQSFPELKLASLENLHSELSTKYDLMLFSNIYMYLVMRVKQYKEFLKNYKKFLTSDGVIQAQYCWTSKYDEFVSYGFNCDLVDPANYQLHESGKKDAVISLVK